ncbi:Uncharacterized protein TCM_040051 [Theobroma cacao]|uniref:Uncharacterized protein n=1 Tax=Theobroma cacao TaxID=3641 RepID=A0A061GT28_THECC|nr:Uncharacterized protein TCM_040051 [Theobroma cacao]
MMLLVVLLLGWTSLDGSTDDRETKTKPKQKNNHLSTSRNLPLKTKLASKGKILPLRRSYSVTVWITVRGQPFGVFGKLRTADKGKSINTSERKDLVFFPLWLGLGNLELKLMQSDFQGMVALIPPVTLTCSALMPFVEITLADVDVKSLLCKVSMFERKYTCIPFNPRYPIQFTVQDLTGNMELVALGKPVEPSEPSLPARGSSQPLPNAGNVTEREVRLSSCSNIHRNASKEADEAIDFRNSQLNELDTIMEESGVSNDLGGLQDLSSWLNIDEDHGLQHHGFIGLDMPIDDLSDLKFAF